MKIGIFGVGSFGAQHISVLQGIKNFNIIGFFDPDKKRANEIQNTFNIKLFNNPLTLIKNCEAIDIVSDTNTHYELIKLGIKHNKHIFVEKPICCTQMEVNRLIQKCENYKSILQVGHIERYNPIIKEKIEKLRDVKSIFAERIGNIDDRNKNIPITLDLMIHDIDLIITIINSRIIHLKASAKELVNGLYGKVECEIIFENGAKANLIARRGKNVKNNRKMLITCINKIVEIDFLNKKRRIYNGKGDVETWIPRKNSNPLKEELVDFEKSIRHNQQPIVGVKESCKAVNIALEVEKLINK